MNNKLIRPSNQYDIGYLAVHMRQADQEECRAGGLTPLRALSDSYEMSTIRYTLIDPKKNEPGAMLGVCPGAYEGMGLIWLLGSPSIENNSITFLRSSKLVLQQLFEESEYDVLYNYTYINNKLHHKWLQWLGFSFLREVPYGPTGHTFIEFVKLRGEPCVPQ